MKTTSTLASIRIGLVGDYDANVLAHRAIPLALVLAGEAVRATIHYEWVGTEDIREASCLSGFDGIWCVPASPYHSMEGALRAIRFARERRRPFLGTCGGFQHAVIDYARNVLGWSDAEHGEIVPDATRPVIAPLSCGLVEVTDKIRFEEGSRIAKAYDRFEAVEGYHCRFGLNPAFESAITSGSLRITARDLAGEARAIELADHPFFVATLFQPERAALAGNAPPLVVAFVRAIVDCGSASAAFPALRLQSG